MPGYQVKQQTVSVGTRDYLIESLLDGTQFFDPHGLALARGIPDYAWSFFGRLWPAGIVLARSMVELTADGRRVLEIGCGLALAGMVAHGRDLDVTVGDAHPLTERFLLRNLELNGLPPLSFRDTSWLEPDPALGRFDVVVASDVLYEAAQPELIARFVAAHASAGAEVTIVDPGRHRCAALTRCMFERGFDCHEAAQPGRMRVLHYAMR